MADFDTTLIWWVLGAWSSGFTLGFFVQFARRLLFLL